MAKILIKYPTKKRPLKFETTLNRYVNFLSGKHEVMFAIILDNDDKGINYITYPNVNIQYFIKEPKGKIDAINYTNDKIKEFNYDILILASDDMLPIVVGYDDIIVNDFVSLNKQYKYNPYDFAIWYFDGYRKDLCTLAVMGRLYEERFGYIYHQSYKSLWADNEFTEVGIKNNRLMKLNTCVIKHDHYENTNGTIDELYILNKQYEQFDMDNFYNRKKTGFL